MPTDAEARYLTPSFRLAGYIWYILSSDLSWQLLDLMWFKLWPCRQLLVFPQGKDGNNSSLAIFLDAMGATPTRPDISFSLTVKTSGPPRSTCRSKSFTHACLLVVISLTVSCLSR